MLENLKRAVELSVHNQDAEKAINKKTNLNYRLRHQVEEGKRKLKSNEGGTNEGSDKR